MSNDGLSTDEKVNLLFKNFMNFTSTLDSKQFFEETALANNTNIFSENILSSLPPENPTYSAVNNATNLKTLLQNGLPNVDIDATWLTSKTSEGSFSVDSANTVLRLEKIELDYVTNGGAAFICKDKNGLNILQNIIPSNYATTGYSISLNYLKNGTLKPIGWLATRSELGGTGFVGSSVNFGGALFDSKNGIITFYDVNGSPSTVFGNEKFYLTATKYIGPMGVTSSSKMDVTGDASFNSDVNIVQDLSVGGNITATNVEGTLTTTSQPNIETLASVSFTNDASFNSSVYIQNDLSATNIETSGNITTNTLTVTGLHIGNDVSINSLSVLNDSSFVSHVYVAQDLSASNIQTSANIVADANIKTDTLNVANTLVGNDVSINNLSVAEDSSFNAHLYVAGDLSATNIDGTITTVSQPQINTMSSLRAVGDLSSGSIAVGFGNINIGAQVITAGEANFQTTNVSALNTNSGTINAGGGTIKSDGGGTLEVTNIKGTIQSTHASQPNITQLGVLNNLTVTNDSSFNADLYIAGDLSATNIQGTLITETQPNITSVGTLTQLDVTADSSFNADLYVAGDLSATNIQGTLTTPSQTAITSVGTLTQLEVTADSSFNADLYVAGDLSATNIQGTLITESQPNITEVGTLDAGSISSNFGNINIGISDFTGKNASLSETVSVDDISINKAGVITTTANDIVLQPKGSDPAIGIVNIKGALKVDGSINFIGDYIQTNTNVQVTEQLDISNAGTGPALIARQHGVADIAEFYDDTTLAMIVTGGPSNGGYVGIGTNAPEVSLHINHTDALKIPKGTTGERPTANDTDHHGYIRYNTTSDQFEGFGAGDAWGSLGGVIDVDQDTYIKAEDNANDDNDQLKFFTDGAQRMIVDANGKVGIGSGTPANELDVVGTAHISNKLFTNDLSSQSLSVSNDSSFNADLYVGGDLSVTNIQGTLTTASQPNVTTMSNLVTVGALDSGSITSGFTSVDVGTGLIAGGDLSANKLSIESDSSFNSDLYIAGDLSATNIQGTLTTASQPNVTTMSNLVTVGALDTGSITSGFTSIDVGTGLIAGGDLSGNKLSVESDSSFNADLYVGGDLSATNIQGTLTTASQPNVTTMSNLVTVGALNSGSITSGFTSVDVGTGLIAGGDLSGNKLSIESDSSFNSDLYVGGDLSATNIQGTLTTASQPNVTTMSNLVTVGALDSGSITSGFTSIDVGTGLIAGGDLSGNKLSIESDSSFNSDLYVGGSIKAGYDTDTTSYFGSAAVGHAAYNDTASFAHVDHNNTTNYALIQDNAGETALNTATGKKLFFKENNAYRMTVAEGNVGIGSTTPGEKLDVIGSASISQKLYATDLSANKISIEMDSSFNGDVYIGGDLSVNDILASHIRTTDLTVTGANTLRVEGSHVAEDISVNKAINVANDSSFNGSVYIAKDLSATNIQASTNIKTSTLNVTGTHTGNDVNINNLVVANDSSFNGSVYITKDLSATNIQATTNIKTSTLNVTGTHTGNDVNINKLVVANDSSFNGDLYIAGDLSATNIQGTLITASQPNIAEVGTLNAGSISSGFGNINIGTSDFTGKNASLSETVSVDDISINKTGVITTTTNDIVLQPKGSDPAVGVVNIKGSLKVDGSINFIGDYIQTNTNVQVTEQLDVSNNGSGPAFIARQHGDTDIAEFYDDNTKALIIQNGGNVGINTDTANEKLDVNGNAKIANKLYATDLSAQTLSISNNSSFNSNLHIKGDLTLDGSLNISDSELAISKTHGLQSALDGKEPTIQGAATTITTLNLTPNQVLTSNVNGKVAVSAVTDTELGYVAGVTSAIQTQLDAKQATLTGGATTIATNNLTATRALVSDGSGKVAVSAVTDTELGYVAGVTSAIQTQLDGKQASLTGAATTIASDDLDGSRALVSDGSGKVAVSAVTDTELGYVAGVTSAIQTQLDAKQATLTGATSALVATNLSASRALASDANGKIVVSDITDTELGYLDDATENIQAKLTDLSSNKQENLTFGIANTNSVVIDGTATNSDYARFTAEGIEGRTSGQVKNDLTLNLVENTALSTWAGSSNITSIGTLTDLNVNATNDVTITTASNKDILLQPGGATDGDEKVHIKGDLTVDGSINFTGGFVQTNTNVQVTDQLDISNNGTGPALIARQHGSANVADFYDDNTVVMRIANGGNVGIGITNPNKKLDVAGDVSANSYYLQNGGRIFASNSGDGWIRFDKKIFTGSNTIATNGKINAGTSGGVNTLTAKGKASIGNSYFDVNAPTDGLIVQGNVGIGITNPTQKLEVSGNIIANDQITVESTSSDAYFRGTTTNTIFQGTNETIIKSLNGPTTFYANTTGNSNERMRIATNGNVGINTPTPEHKLDVSGGNIRIKSSSAAQLIFTNTIPTNTVGPNRIDLFGNKYGLGIASSTLKYTSGSHSHKWYYDTTTNSDGTRGMHLRNGNLGIGTDANSSYGLDVSGDINFSGDLYKDGTIFSGGAQASNTFNGDVSMNSNLQVDGIVIQF